jgi:hypothetical protein
VFESPRGHHIRYNAFKQPPVRCPPRDFVESAVTCHLRRHGQTPVDQLAEDLPRDLRLAGQQRAPILEPPADLRAHVVAPRRRLREPVEVFDLGKEVRATLLSFAQSGYKSL